MTNVLKPAIHGGNLQKAAELYGREAEDFLDFSANISYLGPPPGIDQAIMKGIAVMQHYPDPRSQLLVEKIAVATKLAPDQIVVGNGSIELIYALLRGLGKQKALVLEPTFNEYARSVHMAGGEVEFIHLSRDQEWQVDLRMVAQRLSGIDLVFLCNPNNPTGQLIERTELINFIQKAQEQECLVVVDEAFLDFLEDFSERTYSVLDLVTFTKNLVVLRSFTKFFAIPGLRLGFCAANPALINLIKFNQEPWTVNCIAQSVGELLVADSLVQFRQQVRLKTETARAQMLLDLEKSCGVRCWGQVNYLFVDLGQEIKSATLTKALGYQGILVRDCESFGARFSNYIRVAVKSPEDNLKLKQALQLSLKEARGNA